MAQVRTLSVIGQVQESLLVQSPQDSASHVQLTSQSATKRKYVAFSNDTVGISDVETPARDTHSSPGPLLADLPHSVTPYSSKEEASGEQFKDDDVSNGLPEDTLGNLIRDEMLEPADRTLEKFLPRDKLDDILTEERVIYTLRHEGGFPPERQEDIANEILHPTTSISSAQPHLGSRKEIFAILALIEKVPAIEDFIAEGLYDHHLPFNHVRELHCAKGGRRRQVMKTSDLEDPPQPIQLFSKWRDPEAESFEDRQWRIHVPVFSTARSDSLKPTHYILAQKAVPPYMSRKEVGRGGFSAVDKVEIHPGHVDSSVNLASCSTLNRSPYHPHLIRLLWTFSLGPNYHLVFPCADGNLMDLWKEHKTPPAQKHDHSIAVWFARQCLGIVEGLRMIHQDDSHRQLEGKRHGRHGDLKPENILWFRNFDSNEEGYSLGTLKISDFGLTRFHGTNSKSRIAADGVGGSPTYRAPEYDVYDEVSQSYDIWSLACVLLEFVTWYLKGWEEVDNFSEARKNEGRHPEMGEDTFFSYVRKDQKIHAKAKKSVAEEFQSLYEHENGSDFTLDLVQFIETGLLRMRPDRRKKCTDLHGIFNTFFKDCQKDPHYCLLRLKKPPSRKNTELSLLGPVEVSLSPKMGHALALQDRIHQNDDPVPQAPPRRGSGSSGLPSRPGSPLRKSYIRQDEAMKASQESIQTRLSIGQERDKRTSLDTNKPAFQQNMSDLMEEKEVGPHEGLFNKTPSNTTRQQESQHMDADRLRPDKGQDDGGSTQNGSISENPGEESSKSRPMEDSSRRTHNSKRRFLVFISYCFSLASNFSVGRETGIVSLDEDVTKETRDGQTESSFKRRAP
ncbi:hypothetical protein FSARC_5211 [Fusarium sarcochroum]|uniref:Protein kinase domain-containing protein n=1 Tax=Fusarium sarcochroum TaxID=1208366 RepID=A0A8H4XAN2_9HYPO|nr:hypothetical protein FSARC_5211 [Fusarium sarcochroum]